MRAPLPSLPPSPLRSPLPHVPLSGALSALRIQLHQQPRIPADHSLSIPAEQQHVIPRVAPASKAQLADKAEALARQKDNWSPARKLSRSVRERRKLYW